MVAIAKRNLDDIMAVTRFDEPEPAPDNLVYLIANGDLRDSANRVCWPEQEKSEKELISIVELMDYKPGIKYKVKRAHDYNSLLGHGFISSQRMGNDVFKNIPKGAKIIVAESVWQYSHHIVGALAEHIRNGGQVLTIANYSGRWPGLVGMSNLNASLLKQGFVPGKDFSTIWSENFFEPMCQSKIQSWLSTGVVELDRSHIHKYEDVSLEQITDYGADMSIGGRLAKKMKWEKPIMGGLDFSCMGMRNAQFEPEKLEKLGIHQEYLNQSDLVAKMGLIHDPHGIKAALLGYKNGVSDKEAWGVIEWCEKKGMRFNYKDTLKLIRRLDGMENGKRKRDLMRKIIDLEKNHLTNRQLLEQGKMYIAAVRMTHRFGLDVIGIQYQQGLKDCCAASDLTEGLLNNPDRPDVICVDKSDKMYGKVIRKGEAIPCFNEVDQGCGVDLIFSKRVWKAYGEDPSANQEDVRWSRLYTGNAKARYIDRNGKAGFTTIKLNNEDVWVELLSGSSPASHFRGGYKGASTDRQPGMYFPLGGGTLKGEGKAGEVVISRVYQDENGDMCMNLMRGGVVELPEEETKDRLNETTPQWPIKSLIRYGVSREQMLTHPSNHETILYASSAEMANRLMFAKAQMAKEAGMKVYIWGDHNIENSLEGRAKVQLRKAA